MDLGGTPGVMLAADQETPPAAGPWAALLPALDPAAMGWRDRAWYLGEHAPALFDRSGNIGPTAWWHGRIVGGWAHRKDGEIAVRLLEDAGAEASAAIAAEAQRLREWIVADPKNAKTLITPRFRTPLERELPASFITIRPTHIKAGAGSLPAWLLSLSCLSSSASSPVPSPAAAPAATPSGSRHHRARHRGLVRRRLPAEPVQHHTLSIHSFHPVGIIGSIIGALVLLILLRLFHAEPGRQAPEHRAGVRQPPVIAGGALRGDAGRHVGQERRQLPAERRAGPRQQIQHRVEPSPQGPPWPGPTAGPG